MTGFGLESCIAFLVAHNEPLIKAYAPTNDTKLTNPLLYLYKLMGNSPMDGAFCQIDEHPFAILFSTIIPAPIYLSFLCSYLKFNK